MEKDYLKYYRPGAIVPFILITGTIISAVVPQIVASIVDGFGFNYYQFPSTTILLGLLILGIDKFLWKYKPFKWLLWIEDVSGRYEGEITFNSYLDGTIENRSFALEIEQTGSLIKLKTYFNAISGDTSESESKLISLRKDEFGHMTIFMNYHNKGNSVLEIPEHYGTNILELFDGTIKGKYYTNKNPQTCGIMSAKFVGKELKKRY